ncbi:MAG: adenylyltransferase/cytidyltransferase family protein [Candidatus Levybacteria bacterium]|nr:adenylyltransferase/cytidyltransferase family protein [Candidatus Levybacteria bacterium]
MEHIYSLDNIKELQSSILNLSSVVLAGGCFDILHPGHIAFLKAALAQGDTLIILLESDEQIKKSKGEGRPINSQAVRAENLISKTSATDIILLEGSPSDREYDKIVTLLKPAIIATTENDPYKYHKERQAGLIGASVKEVIKRLEDYSTTKILEEL